jgi:hypothetical protein
MLFVIYKKDYLVANIIKIVCRIREHKMANKILSFYIHSCKSSTLVKEYNQVKMSYLDCYIQG